MNPLAPIGVMVSAPVTALNDIVGCHSTAIFVDFKFKRIHQRDPTGFNDVFADTDGTPHAVFVTTFNHHADSGGRAFGAVDDADFVVHQSHFG